jgi:hypothetical protein
MKTLKSHVRHVLTTDMQSRDNDRHLCWRVWSDILKKEFDSMTISYAEYKRLPSEWTLTRRRREIQKFNPELRGTRYKERKERWEPDVRKECNDSKWEEIESINAERKRKKGFFGRIINR